MAQSGTAANGPKSADEMIKYGIKKVPVDIFHLGEYRYTNLRDAIAQAKRGTKHDQDADG